MFFSSIVRWCSARPVHLALTFLLVLSYFTYVHNFWNPPALFWDENYHIASAQKYLNGTFFMEPHPPLGKFMVVLGEAILDLNPEDNQFIDTDYATNPPAGFSFTGYRLFPVLLAWLTIPVLFFIFLLITKKPLWATFLSFLYAFDNASIVHSRSAMLDSTMLFSAALTILAFLLLLEWKDDRKRFTYASILFGAAFACLMTTKAFGLILILLIPFLAFALRPRWGQILRFLWVGGLAFVLPYVAIWHAHFVIADTINPKLPDQGYYQASDQYKTILAQGKNDSLFAFPIMLRDSWKFVSHYERGVPRLDLCKADENGSPWYLWPVGARTINYRWETPDGRAYRYLYLVSNPVVWLTALAAVILSVAILAASVLLSLKERPKNLFLISVFLTLYASFLIAVSRIGRVLYLYHYFLPLFFAFILVALVFMELRRIGRWELTPERKTSLLLGLAVLIFLSFQFYRPFSYYEPIGDKAFQHRALLKTWELKCVRCDPQSPVAVPRA